MISGLPFALPMPQALGAFASQGAWLPGGFQVGDQQLPVLEFSENFEGWSDDLTRLHEEAAGSDHPVDLASRRDALAQLKQYAGFDGAIVMEIGCSSGFMLKNIRSQMPAARLVGADVVSFLGGLSYPAFALTNTSISRVPRPRRALRSLKPKRERHRDLSRLGQQCSSKTRSGIASRLGEAFARSWLPGNLNE